MASSAGKSGAGGSAACQRHPRASPRTMILRKEISSRDCSVSIMSNSNLPKLPPNSRKLSLTELIPLRSDKISIRHSGLLLPGLVTIAVGLLLSLFSRPPQAAHPMTTLFIKLIAGYLILGACLGNLHLRQMGPASWVLLFPAVVVAGFMLFEPLLSP